MVNLFEIARLAQSGTGFDALSRQLGIDPAQTRLAVEALLPAFTLALQRSALDPTVFAELTRAISSGRYAPFYDMMPGQGSAESGKPVLDLLFRDPEAINRIAAQAASLTGIGAQVFMKMMPILAGTIAGGLHRYATVEGFSDLLRQWADALETATRSYAAASAPKPPPSPSLDPWSAWLDVARSFAGQPAPPPAPRPPANPFEAWTAGLIAATGGRPAPRPAPRPDNPFDALSRMFETGREVQAQHLANLRAILEGVTGPTRSG